jgi:hypothetical protein
MRRFQFLGLASRLAIVLVALSALAPRARAQDEGPNSASDLANKLSNPVASLISVPFQNNVDFGAGGAVHDVLNIQPVIPFSISEDWNLITRNILPITGEDSDFSPNGRSAFGLGDMTSSFFFSPKAPTSGGWIWGAGPVALLPTATQDVLGAGKLGLGLTAVVLKQQSGWTYGVLANQIWSVAGPDGRMDVSATFLQPFLGYTWKSGFSLTGNAESSFDWEHGGRPTIPLNLVAAQVLKLGDQPISIFAGGRVYADRPHGGPYWGLRMGITLLFPQ